MNRRTFFNAITGASTSAVIVPSFEVPKLTANNIEETRTVIAPPPTSTSVFDVAREVARRSAAHVARELFKIKLKGYAITRYDLTAAPKDKLRVGGKEVTLDKHMEATTAIHDIDRALEQPELMHYYLNSVSNALAYAMHDHSNHGRDGIHMVKLPRILTGLGAISEDVDNVRAVITYSPMGFSLLLTVDALYGIES